MIQNQRAVSNYRTVLFIGLAAVLGGCAFIQDQDSEVPVRATAAPQEVVVQEGDTLAAIAERFRMPWQSIYRLNKDILAENGLRVGQHLLLARKTTPGLSTTDPSKLAVPPLGANRQKEAKKLERKLVREKAQHDSEPLEGDLPEEQDFASLDASDDQEIRGSVVNFAWPINGFVTSYFGKRGRKFHKGIDIRGAVGSNIRSASSGQILFTRRLRGYGKTVVVDHGDFLTLYAHCRDFKVQAGELVAEGDVVAHVGMTGNSRGPHLHFEIRNAQKKAIDPFPLLSKKLADFFNSSDKSQKLAQLMNSLLKNPSSIVTL